VQRHPPNLIEILNEPDIGGFMNLGTSQYATHFQRVAAAIRSVNATVPIGGPVTSGANGGYIDALHAQGVVPNFISFHWYSTGQGVDTGGRGPCAFLLAEYSDLCIRVER